MYVSAILLVAAIANAYDNMSTSGTNVKRFLLMISLNLPVKYSLVAVNRKAFVEVTEGSHIKAYSAISCCK